MVNHYEVITSLAELAGEYGDNTYTVTTCALGYIPFKNSENKVSETGSRFIDVARWLLDEAEKNFNDSSHVK